MKLKNMALGITSIALCAWACIANAGGLAQGGTYAGLAGGWGDLGSESSGDLTYWFSAAGSDVKSGGFSGRVYVGYLMPLTSRLLYGPELGYSHYTDNTYIAYNGLPSDNLNITQAGSGIDILLNVTYLLSDRFNLVVKPGFQYAYEKFNSNDTSGIYFPASTSASKFLPELNLGLNWQACADKPIFLGASYQYVFGADSIDLIDRASDAYTPVSSRQMLTLNLEYLFD